MMAPVPRACDADDDDAELPDVLLDGGADSAFEGAEGVPEAMTSAVAEEMLEAVLVVATYCLVRITGPLNNIGSVVDEIRDLPQSLALDCTYRAQLEQFSLSQHCKSLVSLIPFFNSFFCYSPRISYDKPCGSRAT